MTELYDMFNHKMNIYEEILKNINDKFSDFENRILNLENNFKNLKKCNIEEIINNNEEIIELKKESLEIPNDIVEKAIVYKDYRTVLYLFRYYYKKKINENNKYPIRIKSKRIYEYFNNKQWISDNNAHYIKHTLFMNIQTVLYKYNNMDNIKEIDDIYNNQIFINKLSEDKYKRDIFRHIIDEINN